MKFEIDTDSIDTNADLNAILIQIKESVKEVVEIKSPNTIFNKVKIRAYEFEAINSQVGKFEFTPYSINMRASQMHDELRSIVLMTYGYQNNNQIKPREYKDVCQTYLELKQVILENYKNQLEKEFNF
ncbi:hypothetical protein SM120_00170 [Lactococcus lactis subsp. lactis]|uniref:hypothetical protein n=1 Tax=Lactococcus lactis TaxID=1358 RepID=UPI002A83CD18|nr:hypothetical protein [Lactococcus lactis]MDY4362056.1 hypothetical protein [Lactococcus lactis subsp. lactis]